MRLERPGVSTAIIAVVVVVVVAGAAGAYILVLAPKGGNTTTSQSSVTTSTTSSSVSSSSVSSSSSSTSSTSSTSSSSSSTTTSSSSSTSTSCSSTTTTGSSSLSAELNFTAMFTTFTKMSIHYNGTSSGNSFDMTSNYTVIASTSKTFTVNVTSYSGGNTIRSTVYAWKNGTIGGVWANGYNSTGSFAEFAALSTMAAFFIENLFASPEILSPITATGLVHVTSTGTTMLGPTSVNVTNYAADHLPLSIPSCSGTETLSKLSLQTGKAVGTSLLLLTYITISGTFDSGNGPQQIDMTLEITSLTKA